MKPWVPAPGKLSSAPARSIVKDREDVHRVKAKRHTIQTGAVRRIWPQREPRRSEAIPQEKIAEEERRWREGITSVKGRTQRIACPLATRIKAVAEATALRKEPKTANNPEYRTQNRNHARRNSTEDESEK
jgi:hypothetical protein